MSVVYKSSYRELRREAPDLFVFGSMPLKCFSVSSLVVLISVTRNDNARIEGNFGRERGPRMEGGGD